MSHPDEILSKDEHGGQQRRTTPKQASDEPWPVVAKLRKELGTRYPLAVAKPLVEGRELVQEIQDALLRYAESDLRVPDS